MTLQITMVMFSGRADPTWTIDGAQEEQLRRLLDSPDFDPARPIIPWRMGYRGFRVVDLAAPNQPLLRVRDHSLPAFDFFGVPQVEQFLLSTAPPDDPDLAFVLPVRRDIRFSMPSPDIGGPQLVEPRATVQPSKAADALPWNPDDPKWMSPLGGNCYAYGSNRNDRPYTPGDVERGGTGLLYRNDWDFTTAAGALSGVLWDGLFRTTGPNQQLIAGEGFHCCLVIWPERDHHWYRQDASGWWSHKMGGSPITNLDTSGQMIADPRFCNRGPYTIFVAFLRTPPDVWVTV